jgi:hypothetical protein
MRYDKHPLERICSKIISEALILNLDSSGFCVDAVSRSGCFSHHEGREEPSAAKPQPHFGKSPAKARRRKGFEENKFFSELGVFAPSRENDPTPRCSEF